MSDLRQQIRDHYDAQKLSPGKVEAILASGSETGKVVHHSFSPRWRLLALAASVVLAVGLAIWWPGRSNQVSYALLPSRIVEFFQTPPELPKRSQKPEELREWLLAQGAPADFQLPAKLRGLESLGCQVVDVHGRRAWLTCFWRVKKADGSGGELVHLWAVRREDFKDGPPLGTMRWDTQSGWNFASWTQGDMMYMIAAAAPMEKVRAFLTRVELDRCAPDRQLAILALAE